jgi:nucleoside-diphosphate-sugar epimerase
METSMKTIMVTGGTGYIGSWVVVNLLQKGYTVRLCARNTSNPEKFQHFLDHAKSAAGKLELWEADLLKAGSFNLAAKGSDAVMHLASPFTLRYKDPQKDLLDPALEGTRNVLKAATDSGTVKKVVLTSSIAAVFGDNIDMKEKGLKEFTETQFNSSSSLVHQPYQYSKVMAEHEAWSICKGQNAWKLVVINPSFVMGPSLSKLSDSESLNFMKDLLNGRYRMGAPDLVFGFVDVRDVALAHVLALENEKAEGRHIISATTMSVIDLAGIIRKLYGKRFLLPMMEAPKPVLYLMGWMFGLTLRVIARNIKHPIRINNSKSIQELGMTYTPFETTVKDMVDQMTEMKMIRY